MSDEQMPSFKDATWARVKGRGWIAYVKCDRERDRYDTGLIGKVEINGEVFECVGCEVFCLGTPLWEGESMGLIVREVN